MRYIFELNFLEEEIEGKPSRKYIPVIKKAMGAQLPDCIIPTLLFSPLYWGGLETCKLHFPDPLAYWLLVGSADWERMAGDWKVEEREKTFVFSFWC